MLTDYYKLFRLERYSEFNLTAQELYECLESYFPTWSLSVLVSKFETGTYILKSPYIKQRYDHILRTGWKSVLSDPIWLIYVLYIIATVRIRTLIELFKNE